VQQFLPFVRARLGALLADDMTRLRSLIDEIATAIRSGWSFGLALDGAPQEEISRTLASLNEARSLLAKGSTTAQ
jgi:hypothetical protein